MLDIEALCGVANITDLRALSAGASSASATERGAEKGCAYYAARALADQASIVLCPYNYVMDPAIRSAVGIEAFIEDAILIVDEAHNVESVARDGGFQRATAPPNLDSFQYRRIENSKARLVFLRVCVVQTEYAVVLRDVRVLSLSLSRPLEKCTNIEGSPRVSLFRERDVCTRSLVLSLFECVELDGFVKDRVARTGAGGGALGHVVACVRKHLERAEAAFEGDPNDVRAQAALSLNERTKFRRPPEDRDVVRKFDWGAAGGRPSCTGFFEAFQLPEPVLELAKALEEQRASLEDS